MCLTANYLNNTSGIMFRKSWTVKTQYSIVYVQGCIIILLYNWTKNKYKYLGADGIA